MNDEIKAIVANANGEPVQELAPISRTNGLVCDPPTRALTKGEMFQRQCIEKWHVWNRERAAQITGGRDSFAENAWEVVDHWNKYGCSAAFGERGSDGKRLFVCEGKCRQKKRKRLKA